MPAFSSVLSLESFEVDAEVESGLRMLVLEEIIVKFIVSLTARMMSDLAHGGKHRRTATVDAQSQPIPTRFKRYELPDAAQGLAKVDEE